MKKFTKSELLEMYKCGRGISLQGLDEKFRKDKDIVKEAVKRNGSDLQYADRCLRDDEEIVRMALLQSDDGGKNIQYAGEKCRENRELLLLAQEKNEYYVLQWATETLRSDKEFVHRVLKSNKILSGYNLEYVSDELKDDEETVLIAVNYSGAALQYASSRLRSNKDFVLAAVRYDGFALRYADEKFWSDEEVVEAAVRSSACAVESASLKEDKELSKKRILEAVKERKIENLVHFTDAENLGSIIRCGHGLMPRRIMDEKGIKYHCSDGKRLDGEIYSTSLSVSFPNDSMFAQKQQKETVWCVLLLDPEKVLEKECVFFAHNAASKIYRDAEMNKTNRILKRSRCRFIDFDSMFSDSVDGSNYNRYRRDSQLETFYTTSPQAEIMCQDTIEPDCIKSCVFKDEASRQKYEKSTMGNGRNIEFIVDPLYFESRPYFRQEKAKLKE